MELLAPTPLTLGSAAWRCRYCPPAQRKRQATTPDDGFQQCPIGDFHAETSRAAVWLHIAKDW